ncbi:MAG: radical SAM protein [Vulcanimicrobiota bacterium]
MAAMGTMEVSLLGGEPLFRKDIYKIIKASVSRRINTYLTTNATLINEEVVKS